MPLLQLPPEILIQIFDDVGSAYFRSDPSRLTVCKQWSIYARSACFRDLHLTQKTLRRLLSTPCEETWLPFIKDSVIALDLELKGFEDWGLTSDKPEATWNSAQGHAIRDAWTSGVLNDDISHLVRITKQSRKLRHLRIHATSEAHPEFYLQDRRDYLFTSTIRGFLSLSNLASLQLDLCGTRPMPSRTGERFHICTDIAALLPTLQRLRLRMREICPNALKLEQPSTDLRLDEVLVNLSLSHDSPRITSATHAARCGSSPGVGFLQLKADMQQQAKELVAQMASPKRVRVLTHARLNIELEAFDVLTGKNLALGECADWDAAGEVIEDSRVR
ncbi:predicted protein [Uncinocarpus reesii 1704]|uniref:F-box domain-containing protein n=1 Tax=Uncinocarpus reesii (strain UAMH 1704) TaxID=336963 RepID=C4JHC6_UNCRE|nr:uncharacterized protein UREG_02699 [Uncinocarpus reesii 1704]EEP77850.1 predicted protein [Uncinocarpus reesii 1704]